MAIHPVSVCTWTSTFVVLAATLSSLASADVGGAQVRLDPQRRMLGAWDIRTHHPQAAVNDVTQDERGFLWLATNDGVFRFDGSSLQALRDSRVFARQSAVPSALAQAARRVVALPHALFVATANGYLNRAPFGAEWRRGTPALLRVSLDDSKGHGVQDLTAQLPNPWVWALEKASGGGLWIGTEAGLCRWREGDLVCLPQLAGVFITALAEDVHGDLWIGSGRGLLRLRGDTLDAVHPAAVMALAVSARHVYAAADARVCRYDVSDKQLAAPTYVTAPLPEISALRVDRQGALWVGTERGIVRLLRPEREGSAAPSETSTITIADGLPDEKIRRVFIDRENSVWLGTRTSGVVQLRPRFLWNLGPQEGLAGDVVFGVLPKRNGTVWISHNRGLSRWRDGRLTHFPTGDDLADVYTNRALAEHPNGSVWVAAAHEGLLEVDETTEPPRFRLHRQVPTQLLFIASDGAFWIVDEAGGLRRMSQPFDDAASVAVLHLPPACAGRVATLTEWRGSVWAATSTGAVARIAGDGTASCVAKDAGSAHGPAIALAAGADRLWIGLSEPSAVAAIAEDGARVAWKDLAHFGRMGALAVDRHRALWVSTESGLHRYADADGPEASFAAADGLRSQEPIFAFGPGLKVNDNGLMWRASLLGVSVIDTDAVAQELDATWLPAPLRPTVEDIKIAGASVGVPTHLRLHTGARPLEITFVSPSFVRLGGNGRIQFEHRLLGIDSTWSPPSPSRSLLLTSLPAGDFSLQLRAVSSTGALSGVTEISLAVLAPFYRRWWFLIGSALAAATMTAFLYRLRLRALARHYQAVQDERLRLARDLHDGLAQGFSAIGLHVDSVLLNDPQLSPQSQQTLARTRKLIDHVQQEVRRALSSLRVRPGRVALVEALRAVCLESAKLAGIDASVEAKGEAPFGSGRVEHELSMLCREAITNAARHGKAGRVRALIEMSRGTFTLTLVDDGAGWDSRARGEHATGWGLVGMRERVAKLGGTIAFATAEAGGLCIIVQIPAHKLSAAGGA